MSKRVSIEFAVVIIIIIAGFFIGIVYYGNRYGNPAISSGYPTTNGTNKGDAVKVGCKARYYDAEGGEAQIKSWQVGDDGQGGVIVQISNDDVKNLPVNNDKAMTVDSNPKVDLVDPSEEVRIALKNSSSDQPVIVKVRGYAETCDSLIPSVSMNLATVALKKT